MASHLPVLFLVLLSLSSLEAEKRSPEVQVYSRYPPENGKQNYLNCYVYGFHPPQIEIELLQNGKKMKTEQSDLSFRKDWTFYVLTHANFTPSAQDEFVCKVTHETLTSPKIIKWDRDN